MSVEKDPTEFDSIGVVITRQRNGKYKAERVGILDGKTYVIHRITADRTLAWAHNNAVEDFTGVVTSINRGTSRFVEHEVITLKLDEDE